METLLHLDREIFFLVNGKLANLTLDMIMPLARNQYTWWPLYLFAGVFLVYNYGREGFWFIIFAALLILASDQSGSALLKPFFHRLRPCNDPAVRGQVRLLVGCGPAWSFPSSHAANHFALAVFMCLMLRKHIPYLLPAGLLWAGLVGYGQVYCGLHYPGDILGGALLGTALAVGMAWGCRVFVNKMARQTGKQTQ